MLNKTWIIFKVKDVVHIGVLLNHLLLDQKVFLIDIQNIQIKYKLKRNINKEKEKII